MLLFLLLLLLYYNKYNNYIIIYTSGWKVFYNITGGPIKDWSNYNIIYKW